MTDANFFFDNLPFFIPLIIVELVLMITAIVHIFRHQHYQHGNRWLWLLAVMFIQPFGAIAYFVFGRELE
ncbi:PLD nuclease N-terminal domain-containing protein [Lapidilactobacillus bayanensis]|uniref:PLD nuclease N-terminal domain-containing protein n=1 Tax=Lapidilactobacillus bayanensis TaxID=2485998 RepID=UPI000F77E0FF|nr:PLD nuclease N-terminal domain-containing protein [Lapidilactobacillus bayanensis]